MLSRTFPAPQTNSATVPRRSQDSRTWSPAHFRHHEAACCWAPDVPEVAFIKHEHALGEFTARFLPLCFLFFCSGLCFPSRLAPRAQPGTTNAGKFRPRKVPNMFVPPLTAIKGHNILSRPSLEVLRASVFGPSFRGSAPLQSGRREEIIVREQPAVI